MEYVASEFRKVAIKDIIGKKIDDAGMVNGAWHIKLSGSGQLLELVDGQVKE